MMDLREVALRDGQVEGGAGHWRLILPASSAPTYMDAQLDDYAGKPRRTYPWKPGLTLALRARFSHEREELAGTAGFGFWNAPFGAPDIRRPALPQAAWFFYASPPTDLPLSSTPPGRGWFAATLDAGSWRALRLAPLSPVLLLLNQFATMRRRVWPWVREALGVEYAGISSDMCQWHEYHLSWQAEGCVFTVDGQPILATSHSPRGPLGFVCWLDNQYLVATTQGRIQAGVLPIRQRQWLEVSDLTIR